MKEMNNFIITQRFGNTAIECEAKQNKNMENEVLPEIVKTLKDENICAAFILCERTHSKFVIRKEDSVIEAQKIYHSLILLDKQYTENSKRAEKKESDFEASK
jgi:hypothetical protein